MDMTWLALALLFICSLYWYLKQPYTYWQKRNIPTPPTFPLVGSQLPTLQKPLHEVEEERYKSLGRIYGYYEGRRPVLTVGDNELLKNILVKDFASFVNRRKNRFHNRIFQKTLAVLHGEDWKRVRSLITPAFTTGKIKKMTSIILDSAETLCQNFRKYAEVGKPVDARRLFGAFTMDVITSSAFATKVDSHNDPDNPFASNARNFFSVERLPWIWIFFFSPFLEKIYRMFYPNKELNFFEDMTFKIIEERKRSGQCRNDFLQLIMEAAGLVENSTTDEEEGEEGYIKETYFKLSSGKKKTMSRDEVLAQCVMFFLVGYETTASTLCYASYLLALNPDCHERLIKEIDETLGNDKKNLTYEAVQGMKYLDSVICETLRLFPPAPRLEREAANDYELGYNGLTIPKGMVVLVPVYAMHHDPEFYPDPEKFDPDRFSAEAKADRKPYTFLPFGAGPRNCLGGRFALMEIKMCLVRLFSQFRVKRCSETKVPLEFNPYNRFLCPRAIVLSVEERKHKIG